jgi:hypothetical protein
VESAWENMWHHGVLEGYVGRHFSTNDTMNLKWTMYLIVVTTTSIHLFHRGNT